MFLKKTNFYVEKERERERERERIQKMKVIVRLDRQWIDILNIVSKKMSDTKSEKGGKRWRNVEKCG